MPKLNALIIEDNDDDCHLMVTELKHGGYTELEYECVRTEEGLKKALKDKNWDIVLSDYNLPGFNGLDALKIVKEEGLEVPFLLVSGAIGEELAVNALKEGAHNYLLKDNITGLVKMVARELTEARHRKALQEAQELLVVEKKNAEIANQRKSQVLAFVAHEFKNPINALLLHVDLLQKEIGGKLTEPQKEFVNNIAIGARLLQDLVADILDIGAIEAGKIVIQKENVLIKNLLNEILSIIVPLAEQKQIELVFENVYDDLTFSADPKRIKQILINLLSNAVKYTQKGGSVVLSTVVNDTDKTIVFSVKDTGVGLSANELSQLFNEYYRAYNLLTPQSEGVGLGLAVTKQLVELHNGAISVNSTPQVGTEFKVTLPLK